METKKEPRQWTIMVYLAGGSNVSDAARESLFRIKKVGSTENFNLIAQFDTGSEGTATKRYYLTKLVGALGIEECVSKIKTESLGNSLAKLLSGPPPENQDAASKEFELLKSLPVLVGRVPRFLGSVLDRVLITENAKECFGKCLRNPADRKKLVDDPEWLKTCILDCLLEQDSVPSDKPYQKKTDTGDPEVLQKFIQWGNDYYKAVYRMVIIWGHGDGFSIAWDATPSNDPKSITAALPPKNPLKAGELPKAFEVDPPVDIVGFNACQMGMIEVYHRLNGKVDYGVASEGYTPTTSWPYDEILSFLQNNPTLAPEDLASGIVDTYGEFYKGSAVSKEVGLDLSACDIRYTETVAYALGDIAKLILGNILDDNEGKLRRALVGARSDVQEYSETGDYIDLDHFCQLLQKKCKDEQVKNEIRDAISKSCERVISLVGNMVLNIKKIGNAAKDSKGLSIYFPQGGVPHRYRSLAIRDTDWIELLRLYPTLDKENTSKLFKSVGLA